MARKKALPEGYRTNLNLGQLAGDGDFLDEFDPDVGVPKKTPARQTSAKRAAATRAPKEQDPPQPKPPALSSSPAEPDTLARQQPDEVVEPTATSSDTEDPPKPRKKPGPKPNPRRKKKPRPPRADIGFRQDLEDAAAELRKDAVQKSAEPGITRTDVISAATRCLARAAGHINYSRIQARGHYGSDSARALNAALEEAYFQAIGLHFLREHAHQLPDAILERCHNIYIQKMKAEEDDQLLTLSNLEG